MIQNIRGIASTLGIDRAILYTVLTRIIGGLGGVVSILFVAHYLTRVEQGFYYTFASILAIQVFFDLGLNSVITQYVAHEVSHLKKCDNRYDGDQKHLSRLSSLLHFSVKWYLFIAAFLFFTLFAAGYLFFSKFYKSDDTVAWIVPWGILALGTALNLLISPLLAFLEGLNSIKEIAKLRLIQQGVNIFILWCGLYMGGKLYVGGVGILISFAVALGFIVKGFWSELLYIWQFKIIERVGFRKEIFPYQWKIALSWVSGYFIFQLFNPVLFATEGPVAAGQMGMTLVALNAIMALSMSWMSTKVPTFSGLIAQKKYDVLDELFQRTLWQSSIINGSALVVMFIAIFFIRYFNVQFESKTLGDRFISNAPMAFMMVSVLLNHISGSWATYLRCHKQEPLMIQSIVVGVLCALSTIMLGRYYGLTGMTIGYMIIVMGAFIWTYFIYIRKKQLWHSYS